MSFSLFFREINQITSNQNKLATKSNKHLLAPFSALSEVSNPGKRQLVRKERSTVIDARSAEQFEELFEKAMKWSSDEDTKAFGDYMQREYSNK